MRNLLTKGRARRATAQNDATFEGEKQEVPAVEAAEAATAGAGPTDANGAPAAVPSEFAKLASWTDDKVLDWVSAHSTHSDSLQALDEACQALPEPQRSEVNQRITEAYTWLARHTLATILESKERRTVEEAQPEAEAGEAQPVAVEAEADDDAEEDLEEEKGAILDTIDSWAAADPTIDELLGLVHASKPGYYDGNEGLAAALVELQQQGVIQCDDLGVVRKVASDAEAAETPSVHVVPSTTGTVIAEVTTATGQRSFLLIAGPYQLSIPRPSTDAERLLLALGLLMVVDNRLEDFQSGPFSCPQNRDALRFVSAAQFVLQVWIAEVTGDASAHFVCDACGLDDSGPGGALHLYKVNNLLTVQLQKGPRAEAGSVAGVLDLDLLQVARHLLNDCAWAASGRVAVLLVELAEGQLTERQTERIARGVFGLSKS